MAGTPRGARIPQKSQQHREAWYEDRCHWRRGCRDQGRGQAQARAAGGRSRFVLKRVRHLLCGLRPALLSGRRHPHARRPDCQHTAEVCGPDRRAGVHRAGSHRHRPRRQNRDAAGRGYRRARERPLRQAGAGCRRGAVCARRAGQRPARRIHRAHAGRRHRRARLHRPQRRPPRRRGGRRVHRPGSGRKPAGEGHERDGRRHGRAADAEHL